MENFDALKSTANFQDLIPFIFGGFIFLLLIVLVIQQIRIRKLSKPRYGFLGKPLSLMILGGIGFLSIGIGSNIFIQRNQDGDISVNQIIKNLDNYILIEYSKIEGNQYRFRGVPILNKAAWGVSGLDLELDFEWEFFSSQMSNIILDHNVSQRDNLGIIFSLQRGLTIVKVKTIVNDQVLEGEIEIKL